MLIILGLGTMWLAFMGMIVATTVERSWSPSRGMQCWKRAPVTCRWFLKSTFEHIAGAILHGRSYRARCIVLVGANYWGRIMMCNMWGWTSDRIEFVDAVSCSATSRCFGSSVLILNILSGPLHLAHLLFTSSLHILLTFSSHLLFTSCSPFLHTSTAIQGRSYRASLSSFEIWDNSVVRFIHQDHLCRCNDALGLSCGGSLACHACGGCVGACMKHP